MSVPKALMLARAPRTALAVSLAPWAAGTIAFSLVLQAYVALTRQINWDEFYFLSRIYDYRRGDLNSVLQTFYVHLFAWLPLIPLGTIGQIVVARLVMLALETGTLGLIYYSARRFVSRDAALLGVLSYATFGYVVIYGASFRADPIATFLLMSAVALYLAPNLSWKQAIVGAAAVALAGLITIKAVFYLPIIAAILWLRVVESNDRRKLAVKLGAGMAASLVLFAILYILHRASIASSEHISAAAAKDFDTVFAAGAFGHTWNYLAGAVIASPATFAAIVLGIAFSVRSFIHAPAGRSRAVVLLFFVFPLATLFFYRNSFPYYYPFVLAPAAVLAAIAFDRMPQDWMKPAWGIVFALCMLLQIPAAISPGQAAQRATLEAIHAMFPDPVAYIGRCGMVSDYPRSGFFMSSWGVAAYRAAGKPVLRDAILKAEPRFVIANTPVLRDALAPGSVHLPPDFKLLDTDARTLQRNYVHQWGDVWVAGRNLGRLRAGEARNFPIHISGSYTIEASAPIILDGATRAPGTVVNLTQGNHVVRSANATQTILLRWGDHLKPPPIAPPSRPIFDGF